MPDMSGSEDFSHLRSKHALERGCERLDDGDVRVPGGGRGYFQADPASTDDDNPQTRLDRLLDRIGISDPPQILDAIQVRTWQLQAAGCCTGRDQNLVEAEGVAAVQRNRAVGEIERSSGTAEHELHVILGVPGLRLGKDLRQLLLAEQILLGQRRALVGQRFLVPHDHDPPVVPLLSEGLCCPGCRKPTPDDDGYLIRHGSLPSSRLPASGLCWCIT